MLCYIDTEWRANNPVLILLSSWHSHFKCWPGSSDECRLDSVPGGHQPQTSKCLGLWVCHPHFSLPIIYITCPRIWCFFAKRWRLSRPGHYGKVCSQCLDLLHWSSWCDKHNCSCMVGIDPKIAHLSQSDILPLECCKWQGTISVFYSTTVDCIVWQSPWQYHVKQIVCNSGYVKGNDIASVCCRCLMPKVHSYHSSTHQLTHYMALKASRLLTTAMSLSPTLETTASKFTSIYYSDVKVNIVTMSFQCDVFLLAVNTHCLGFFDHCYCRKCVFVT